MKHLTSLKDFQKENLDVLPKAQMQAVFGGDPTNYSYSTISNAGLRDTEKQVWRDNCHGNSVEFYSVSCIDSANNSLKVGEYRAV